MLAPMKFVLTTVTWEAERKSDQSVRVRASACGLQLFLANTEQCRVVEGPPVSTVDAFAIAV